MDVAGMVKAGSADDLLSLRGRVRWCDISRYLYTHSAAMDHIFTRRREPSLWHSVRSGRALCGCFPVTGHVRFELDGTQ
jgi:hypothetical protein